MCNEGIRTRGKTAPPVNRRGRKFRKSVTVSNISQCLFLFPSAYLSVCFFVHREQFCPPTGTIFVNLYVYSFRFLKIFPYFLKPDKNNRYYTSTSMYTFDSIFLNSSWNEKYFRQICTENRNTRLVFTNTRLPIANL